MSLKYILFGIPATLDEFIDRTRRKKIREARVVVWADSIRTEYWDGDKTYEYYCYVGVKAGRSGIRGEQKGMLKLDEYHIKDTEYLNELSKAVTEQPILKKAVDIADKLVANDLETTINGCDVNWVRKMIVPETDYGKTDIQAKRGEYLSLFEGSFA